ncbi:MAG: hypothetical protein HKN01_03705 [Acidimicrobiia bacterium]|nr:hypothetical protein [Acidimicrobiia bacterium]
MDPTDIAAKQLARMRGMTRYYHERFFADVRWAGGLMVALFVAGWSFADEAFLVIPFVALWGATQTAFDASYLIFARQYAARLERYLNSRLGTDVLIAAELEDAYLFPLGKPKIVTAAFGKGFSWFGFMTLFTTALGLVGFGYGLVLGMPELPNSWRPAYLGVLFTLTLVALLVGTWWFVTGVGERRLEDVLDRTFPS